VTEKDTYEMDIRKALSSYDNRFKEVTSLDLLRTLDNTEENRSLVKKLIGEKKIPEIRGLGSREKSTFDDITVVTFCDLENHFYVAISYDSDELWQDPVIIELHPY
jgi:hypothetical protein